MTFEGKIAAWARDHHLGVIVDVAESIRYRDPPQRPSELQVGAAVESSDITVPLATEIPSNVMTVVRPPLKGEGEWRVARSVNGQPVAWVTGIRPSVKYEGITATHVLINQSNLVAVLHNGTQIPGGKGWRHSGALSAVEVSRAVFAFNGGFRREHADGGYLTEGREIWPLKRGAASLAIDSLGHIYVGRWGIELDTKKSPDGPWISVRQNLALLVINGELSPDLNSGYWGGGAKGELFILRSGVCTRSDGKLVFTISGLTDATELARAMRDAGCQYAMQLDQNESYPRGYVFESGTPTAIDNRMKGRIDDFVRGYPRDFVVLLEN